jgi:hypothetical protein
MPGLANPDDPTVPIGCTTADLPTGIAAEDCFIPELNYGYISDLYWASEPFSATPTATSFAAALTAGTMVGPLICELSTASTTDQVERINGTDYPKPTDLLLNVKISDTKQANYDLARSTQKGGQTGYFYGLDKNGYIYGGQNGLTGGRAHLLLRNNIPAGETDLHTITGTLKGRGLFDPVRSAAPVPYLR